MVQLFYVLGGVVECDPVPSGRVVTGVARWDRPPGSDPHNRAERLGRRGARGPSWPSARCSRTTSPDSGSPRTACRSRPSRFAASLDVVAQVDPVVADAMLGELVDQRTHLKLIASENFASPAVLFAMGNWLSDKYAEGAPGHRLYAGCDNVDVIEARTRTNSPARCSAPSTRTRSLTAGSTPTSSPSGRCCHSAWSHLRWSDSRPVT